MTIDHHILVETGRAIIRRESAALKALPDQLGSSFAELVSMIAAAPGKVITSGVGTSGIMAERLAHLLAVSGTPSFYLPCLDALHGGMGAVTEGDTLIAFSKGGRSSELTQLAERLVERGHPVVAVTEQPDSPFAQAASRVITVRTDPADADLGTLLATGSTLVVGAWGDALAGTLMALRGSDWAEVIDVHPGGSVGAQSDLPEPLQFHEDASHPDASQTLEADDDQGVPRT